jgi:hypothetical protein
MELYDWNAAACGAYMSTVHYVEVGLRNAIDVTASARLGDDWLAALPLNPRSSSTLSRAITRAGGSEVPRGKVVAELSFGFWCFLFSDAFDGGLWRPALQYAFDGPVRRKHVYADVNSIRTVRNRAAHHEPIHARDLPGDYARILDVAGRISPVLRSHIETRSSFPGILAKRPQVTGDDDE